MPKKSATKGTGNHEHNQDKRPLCSAVIDRSAGEACNGIESVIECIKRAKNDLHVAICGGGWKQKG